MWGNRYWIRSKKTINDLIRNARKQSRGETDFADKYKEKPTRTKLSAYTAKIQEEKQRGSSEEKEVFKRNITQRETKLQKE